MTDQRDYIERTIATVRNHRAAENCWPQWANIFADEIERLWSIEEQLAAAQSELTEWRTSIATEKRDWRIAELEEQLETLRTALDVAGRHLEDCCRTDIDLGKQLDTHNDAVDAVHRAERITSSDGRGNQEHLSSAQAASPACPEFDPRVDYPERYREGPI